MIFIENFISFKKWIKYHVSLTGNDKGDIYLSKSQFAENSHSDHMVNLRAFQAWQNSRVNNIAEMYCIERNLNNEVLEIVTNVRIMILGHLRACGFVRAKGI